MWHVERVDTFISSYHPAYESLFKTVLNASSRSGVSQLILI
uniref:Uncharacterized protein n=1 Tax=Arundo donax TaxID=35708 RepID=A0A0A9GPV7_ARUDO